jgi:hypothetical protein
MGANVAIPTKRQRRYPMPLSWNEIRARALVFSREWADESSEDAEGKSFCDEFFNVFGITRRRVASFEKKVKKIDGKDGYIDLLWKGVLLATLFHVLNTSDGGRLTTLDEDLAAFPYVNGRLFEEPLPPAAFDSAMRQALLDCCGLDWSRISPAIFGSLFQSVMDPALRRNLGAHYTREENILKLIRPLFLDALRAETDLPTGNKAQRGRNGLYPGKDRFSGRNCRTAWP